jgi:hypothetical protein
MGTSRVLVVIIASNTKKQGGGPGYHREQSILAHVPSAAADELMQGRRWALRWILRSSEATRDGQRLADLPANRSLVAGPEFGGESTQGLYLPAAERFRGRLFLQLGPGAAQLLQTTSHHLLILSGLYGLVLPSEPVQNYQCYIEDHPNLRGFWTEGDLLTNVLLAYVKQQGITHVFDLTPQNSYRFLIAWHRVRTETQQVLHCFGAQSVGPGFLIPLGVVARDLLSKATEAQLLSIQPGSSLETPYERVYFQPSPTPPADAPHEAERQRALLNAADELDRMSRCIERIIDAVSLAHDYRGPEEGTGRIKPLKREGYIDSGVAGQMWDILQIRGPVHHDGDYPLTETDLQRVRAEYAEVRTWAEDEGLVISEECLEV